MTGNHGSSIANRSSRMTAGDEGRKRQAQQRSDARDVVDARCGGSPPRRRAGMPISDPSTSETTSARWSRAAPSDLRDDRPAGHHRDAPVAAQRAAQENRRTARRSADRGRAAHATPPAPARWPSPRMTWAGSPGTIRTMHENQGEHREQRDHASASRRTRNAVMYPMPMRKKAAGAAGGCRERARGPAVISLGEVVFSVTGGARLSEPCIS